MEVYRECSTLVKNHLSVCEDSLIRSKNRWIQFVDYTIMIVVMRFLKFRCSRNVTVTAAATKVTEHITGLKIDPGAPM